MSLTTNHDLIRDTPANWPDARAWIYGWIRTDVVGYRELKFGASTVTATSGTYRADQFVSQLATKFSSSNWTVSQAVTGKITLSKSSGAAEVVTWTDRLGWMLGMAPGANYAEQSSTSIVSRWVPPMSIPLTGAVWSEVTIDREVETEIDRAGRRSGYVAGGARLWRWKVTCTRWALQAIQCGVVMSGKVTISPHPSVVTANDSTHPTGGVTGYIVRAGSPKWIGPNEDFAELELVLSGAVE